MGSPTSPNLFKENGNNTFNPAPAMVIAKISSKQEVNAKSIQKNKVISTNGECSCSLYTNTASHKKSWVNYCPKCHKYGTLSFTRGGGCPEGMLYCNMAKGGCDADYCAVHGKEHINRGADHLIPA